MNMVKYKWVNGVWSINFLLVFVIFLEQIIVKGEFLKFIRGRVYVRKKKYKIKKRETLW